MSQSTWQQPMYVQIAEDLRSQITSGRLVAGDQLPTEDELQQRYGVARGTVQKGLRQLVTEGLVIAQRPRGHFVRSVDRLEWTASTDERHDLPSDWWVEMVRSQGLEPSHTIRVEIVKPPEHIRANLDLGPDDFTVVRRRIWYINKRPSATYDSFYPESIARHTPLAQPDDIKRGGRHVLADAGHRMVSHRDEITARGPHPEESLALQIPAGTPVIEHLRTSADSNDLPVRCALSVLPGDRYVLTYSRRDPV